MKFLKNLHTVSEILFFILGGLYLTAFVFIKNNFFVWEAELFVRFADIPFALVCIIFGITSLRLSFTHHMIENERDENSEELMEAPILDAILIIIGLALFLSVVFLNFAFEDLV